LQGEIQTSSGHRRMTESDPQPTKAGLKSRNAAPPAMLRCAILSGSTGGIGSETARVIRIIFKPVKWALLALKVSGTLLPRHLDSSFVRASFNHLVGEREQLVWNLEAKRLRSLEVDG